MRGVLLGSRVLGAVSVMLLLSSVTPAYKIFGALRWFHVPEGWVEIALLVYRYTFVLLDQTADIASAQRVRLGYSSLGRSLSSAGVLAGTVVARSMDQAMRTYEAMTLRGYQGRLPMGPLAELKARDWRTMFVVSSGDSCRLPHCGMVAEVNQTTSRSGVRSDFYVPGGDSCARGCGLLG